MAKQNVTVQVTAEMRAEATQAKAEIEKFRKLLQQLKGFNPTEGLFNEAVEDVNKAEVAMKDFFRIMQQTEVTEKDVKSLNKAYETMSRAFKRLNIDADALTSSLKGTFSDDQLKTIKNMNSQLDKLKDALSPTESNVYQQLTKDLEKANKELKKLQDSQANKQKTLDDAKTFVKGEDTKSLNKKIGTQRGKITNAEKARNDLLEKGSVDDRKAKIKETSSKLKVLTSYESDLKEAQKLKSKKTLTDAEKNKLTGLETKIKKAQQSKLPNNFGDVKDYEDLAAVQKTINKLTEENKQLQSEINTIQDKEKTIKAANEEIKVLEQKQKTLEKIDELEKEVNEADKKTKGQEGKVNEIKLQLKDFDPAVVSKKTNELKNELLKFAEGVDDEVSAKLQDVFNNFDSSSSEEQIQQVNNALEILKNSGLEPATQAVEDYKVATQEVGDNVNGLKKIGDALEDNVDSTKVANQELENLQNSMLQFFSLTNGWYLLKRAISNAFETVKEMDAAMTEIAVVSEYTINDLWAMKGEFSSAASEMGASTLDLVNATKLYIQQGMDLAESTEVATETIKMARIANIDGARATELMTTAIRGFKLEMQDASSVNDTFSQLAAKTAADTEQIATALSKTASLAESAGASFENTSAFLTQIIETTQEAPETAGTALKTIIARFQELKKAPSEIGEVDGEIVDANGIETALKSAGVALRGTNGEFRNFDDVIMELAGKWESLDVMTQRYIATMAAGSRQQSRFLALMSDNARLTQLVGYANNSAGASNEQFEKTLESLDSKLNKLNNAVKDFWQGLANNEVIKVAVDGLTLIVETANKIASPFTEAENSIMRLIGSFGQLALAAGALKAGQGIVGNLGGKAIQKVKGIWDGTDKGTKSADNDKKSADGTTATPKTKLIDRIAPRLTPTGKLAKATDSLKGSVQDTANNLEIGSEALNQNDQMVKFEADTTQINAKIDAVAERIEGLKQKARSIYIRDMGTPDADRQSVYDYKMKEHKNDVRNFKQIKRKRSSLTVAEQESHRLQEKVDLQSQQYEERDGKDWKTKFRKRSQSGTRTKQDDKFLDTFKKKQAAQQKYNKMLSESTQLNQNYDDSIKQIVSGWGLEADAQLTAQGVLKTTGDIQTAQFILGNKELSQTAQEILAQEGLTEAKKQQLLTELALNNGMRLSGIEKAKNIVLMLFGGKAARQEAMAKLGLTAANTNLTATQVALNSAIAACPIGWIILGIAAIIALIAGVVALQDALVETDSEKLERLNEELDAASDAAEKAKQAVDDLKSSWDNWRSADDKLDNLRVGTLEWQQALVEANAAAMELINNYENIQWDVDKTGQIQIDSGSYQKALKEQTEKARNAQATELAAQARQQEVVRKQRLDAATDDFSSYDEVAKFNEYYKWSNVTNLPLLIAADATQYAVEQEQVNFGKALSGKVASNQGELTREDYEEIAQEFSLADQNLTETEFEELQDILRDNYKAQLEQVALQKTAIKSAQSTESAQYKYNDSIVNALVQNGELSDEVTKELADNIHDSDGKSDYKDSAEMREIMNTYGVETTGDDLEDLQNTYAAMTGIAVEDITDSIKENKEGLAKAIANAWKTRESGIRAEKIGRYMQENLTESQQYAAQAMLSGGALTQEARDEFKTLGVEGYLQKYFEMTKEEFEKQFGITAEEVFGKAEEDGGAAIDKATERATARGLSTEHLKGLNADAYSKYITKLSLLEDQVAAEALNQAAGDLFSGITDAYQRQQAWTALTQTNWKDIDSIETLRDSLEAAGVDISSISDYELEKFQTQLKDTAKATRQIDLKKLSESLNSIVDFIDEIFAGTKKTLTDEEVDMFVQMGLKEEDFYKGPNGENVYKKGTVGELGNTLFEDAAKSAYQSYKNAQSAVLAQEAENLYKDTGLSDKDFLRKVTNYVLAKGGSLEGFNVQGIGDTFNEAMTEEESQDLKEMLIEAIAELAPGETTWKSLYEDALRNVTYGNYASEAMKYFGRMGTKEDNIALQDQLYAMGQDAGFASSQLKKYNELRDKANNGDAQAAVELRQLTYAMSNFITEIQQVEFLENWVEGTKTLIEEMSNLENPAMAFKHATAIFEQFGMDIFEIASADEMKKTLEMFTNIMAGDEEAVKQWWNKQGIKTEGPQNLVKGNFSDDLWQQWSQRGWMMSRSQTVNSENKSHYVGAYYLAAGEAPGTSQVKKFTGEEEQLGIEYNFIEASDPSVIAKQIEEAMEEEEWSNPFDWLHNLIEDTNKQLRERNRLEYEYTEMLREEGDVKLSEIRANHQSKFDTLTAERANLELQKERRMKELSVITEAAGLDLKNYVQYDAEGQHPTINYDLMNSKIKTATKGEMTEAFYDEVDRISDDMQSLDESLMENADALYEWSIAGRDEYIQLYGQILDMLQQIRQDEIDTLTEVNDSVNEMNTDVVSKIQEGISEYRQQRQNEESLTEIQDLSSKLALMQTDTSGSNLIERLSLSDELSDKRQSYTDSLIDQAIDAITKQNEEAYEQRQSQIELMQHQLEADLINGNLAKTSQGILEDALKDDGDTSIIKKLMEATKDKFLIGPEKDVAQQELEETFAAAGLFSTGEEDNETQDTIKDAVNTGMEKHKKDIINKIPEKYTLPTQLEKSLTGESANGIDGNLNLLVTYSSSIFGKLIDINNSIQDATDKQKSALREEITNIIKPWDVLFDSFGNVDYRFGENKESILKELSKDDLSVAELENLLNSVKEKNAGWESAKTTMTSVTDSTRKVTEDNIRNLVKTKSLDYISNKNLINDALSGRSLEGYSGADLIAAENELEKATNSWKTYVGGDNTIPDPKYSTVGTSIKTTSTDKNVEYVSAIGYELAEASTNSPEHSLHLQVRQEDRRILDSYWNKNFEEWMYKVKEHNNSDETYWIRESYLTQLENSSKIKILPTNKPQIAGRSHGGRSFKTGGLADFTGPAWLDGTKTRPELVLNAKDTQNFILLKDILDEAVNGTIKGKSSESKGDVYYDVHIDVDKIENDYDVEKMMEKMEKIIVDSARYRNVNAISTGRR